MEQVHSGISELGQFCLYQYHWLLFDLGQSYCGVIIDGCLTSSMHTVIYSGVTIGCCLA